MVPKWPQNDPEIAQNDLNGFKVTSETISIEFLPLLRSFWVVTWLVCDKFEFGDKNGSKWSQNGPKITLKLPKKTSTGSNWLPKPSPSKFCPSCGPNSHGDSFGSHIEAVEVILDNFGVIWGHFGTIPIHIMKYNDISRHFCQKKKKLTLSQKHASMAFLLQKFMILG